MQPKANQFIFKDYNFNAFRKSVVFEYKIEFVDGKSLNFKEKLILPKVPVDYNKKAVHKVLQGLFIITGISYYKLYCPPEIKLPFRLSKEQADFWNTVYKKGLGEFLYQNKLKPENLARFPFSKNVVSSAAVINPGDKILLGIGGGKDSIVAGELLKSNNYEFSTFLLETQRLDLIAEGVAKKMKQPVLKIHRELDPQIFEDHEKSYNGHIPISAIIAFTGLFMAILYKYKYFVVANEYSSNFGNVKYYREEINHQWSKSMEFEKMFQEYSRKHIVDCVKYFSVIRQFHEIRVAKIFAEKGEWYFSVFASCNRNFKINKQRSSSLWCGECPKCAFVFLMLAPFISKNKLISIFGKNLLEDKKLIPLFRDLLGFGETKPFDCVGTFEETRVAFELIQNKYKNSPVVKKFKSKIKMSSLTMDNVFKTRLAPTLPTPFRFLGIETVGILGYGREGKVTEKYLKKNYPNLKIGILDSSLDKKYLSGQEKYDLIIKTPGIQKSKVTRPYTTATNIFFSKNRNFTIGITGSKGKSTTSTLVYEIIKASGKKVRLLGNIGSPMLETLLDKKVDPKEIFVLELSSYMLSDIEYSPDVAVILNKFPDHINYHNNKKEYYKTKDNIFKFQDENGILITAPFRNSLNIKLSDIELRGEHNLQNVLVAIEVAKVLKISDEIIKQVIKKFKPLMHRLEFVGNYQGIDFYDDANATTPEATIAALKTLKKVETIFLGGEDRGYDFTELEAALRKYHVRNIVLFPDTGQRMLQSWKGFNVLETRDMEEAVRFAYQNTNKGKICLLSMASPSYSLWKNFEEKGDLFQRVVKQFGI